MSYALFLLAVCYILIVALYKRNASQLVKPTEYAFAVGLWPLLFLTMWLNASTESTVLSVMIYLAYTLIPVILALQYKVVIAQIVKHPVRNSKIWLPAIAVGLSCISLLVVPPDALIGWLQHSPSSGLSVNWPFYLIHLLLGFAVLMLGVVIAEHVQRYHYYLSDQVVDPGEYRIKKIKHGYGFVVACALCSIVLVIVSAFGVLTIPNWSLLSSTLTAAAVLVAMLGAILPHQSSPSPIDYFLLENKNPSRAVLQQALDKAHDAIIKHKLYKKFGLTLAELAELAKVDPTILAKATREINQQKFRRYLYEYRLDYAKKVLLRSDTKIADVANKLGLNSKKFLNEVLVEHLRNFKS
ncbi:helix-turn-helix transcriptional regulator [Alteromonas sp. ASW11-130]|uniref:helix-turn-helix transcriptional regulator n=1 Tax=Alteromonas sp. ASW11-130 TaxID=3015775 RepID=UPI002241E8C0|nr:hypothetical protein [Alteromonas sp. ASW11-130]MCW8091876.1 hypothetical protein [Alteromonas sp. ASW11-130]